MKAPLQKPQDEEWEDPYPKKKGTHWFTGLFLALVIYLLSTGPAELLRRKGVIPEPALRVVYAPVIAVINHFPPAERAIEWYLGLWGK